MKYAGAILSLSDCVCVCVCVCVCKCVCVCCTDSDRKVKIFKRFGCLALATSVGMCSTEIKSEREGTRLLCPEMFVCVFAVG